MRIGLVCAAVAAVAFSSAVSAQPQQQPQQQQTFPLSNVLTSIAGGSMPAGWTRNMDGTYKQAQSGVLCPKSFGGYSFASIDVPNGEPNILGICHYADGQGRTGAVRIRSYLEGWHGDNEALAANDKTLMGQNAPPMLMRRSVDRPNGGSRITVTVVKNGLLVDCSVWQASHESPDRSFPLYCSTLTGG